MCPGFEARHLANADEAVVVERKIEQTAGRRFGQDGVRRRIYLHEVRLERRVAADGHVDLLCLSSGILLEQLDFEIFLAVDESENHFGIFAWREAKIGKGIPLHRLLV